MCQCHTDESCSRNGCIALLINASGLSPLFSQARIVYVLMELLAMRSLFSFQDHLSLGLHSEVPLMILF